MPEVKKFRHGKIPQTVAQLLLLCLPSCLDTQIPFSDLVRPFGRYGRRTICAWKDVDVQELNVRPDHVHLVCSVPPKLSVADVVGTIKGKTTIRLSKAFPTLKKKPYGGNHFWARGYFVSTLGLDEEKVRRYGKYQEGRARPLRGVGCSANGLI